MRKREVYSGWRYGCEEGLFRFEDGRLTFNSAFDKNIKKYVKVDVWKDKDKLEFEYTYTCPCGKGCKPIRCRIIVENEV